MRTICCLLVAIPFALLSMSSSHRPYGMMLNRFTSDSTTVGKYTIVALSNDSAVSAAEVKRLVDVFFDVYPKEADRFNPNTLTRVIMIVDTSYKGVAATGGGVVRINPQWLIDHPEDIDVVTHEVMHIVQDYRGRRNPGWLTEGIADYARYVYGVNNKASGWKLPDYKPTQSYRNAYRVTARFLLWAEKKKDAHLVDELDAALRNGRYTQDMWVKLTGSTVDALWDEYSKDPAIDLSYR